VVQRAVEADRARGDRLPVDREVRPHRQRARGHLRAGCSYRSRGIPRHRGELIGEHRPHELVVPCVLQQDVGSRALDQRCARDVWRERESIHRLEGSSDTCRTADRSAFRRRSPGADRWVRRERELSICRNTGVMNSVSPWLAGGTLRRECGGRLAPRWHLRPDET